MSEVFWMDGGGEGEEEGGGGLACGHLGGGDGVAVS